MAGRPAARKGPARAARGRAAPPKGVRLWPARLGLTLLRVFTGATFLSAAWHKLFAHGLGLDQAIVIFAEQDYLHFVEQGIAHPPEVLGWKLEWYADFLEAVMLPGNAPYVFGAAILFFEALLGVSLVLGACARLCAFLGALLMTAFGMAKSLYFLTVTGTNWYLAAILLTLSLTGAGRIWGLDARLRRRLPGWIA